MEPLIWATDGEINWVMPPLDAGPLCAWTSRGVYANPLL